VRRVTSLLEHRPIRAPDRSPFRSRRLQYRILPIAWRHPRAHEAASRWALSESGPSSMALQARSVVVATSGFRCSAGSRLGVSQGCGVLLTLSTSHLVGLRGSVRRLRCRRVSTLPSRRFVALGQPREFELKGTNSPIGPLSWHSSAPSSIICQAPCVSSVRPARDRHHTHLNDPRPRDSLDSGRTNVLIQRSWNRDDRSSTSDWTLVPA
jgi:hypothetical protein